MLTPQLYKEVFNMTCFPSFTLSCIEVSFSFLFMDLKRKQIFQSPHWTGQSPYLPQKSNCSKWRVSNAVVKNMNPKAKEIIFGAVQLEHSQEESWISRSKYFYWPTEFHAARKFWGKLKAAGIFSVLFLISWLLLTWSLILLEALRFGENVRITASYRWISFGQSR